MKKVSKAAIIFLGLVTILNYLPIILTVVYSFNKSKLTSVWDGFSLDWYKMLLNDGDIKKALLNSIILALLACMLSLIIGVSAALAMRGKKLIFDDFISNFASLPIMIPEIILGMVFMAIFSYMNLPFGFVTMTIAHSSFCIPYIFLIVRARLMGMDLSLEEAARDLGASEFETFRDVTLPYILPGIASGMLLSFAMSFDDVVISIFTTGPSVNTLAIKIYTKMKTGITPEINALATVILVITVLIIFISEKTRKD
ncbi:ABC transporter permease [Lachnoanaerobaculum umeaense]|uniref:ABC transporter permease n=1 Tax=Lachnoanaerobaculum umeaense TaxID=617123 RepID=A0A385Q353_9FIRM|nr:ABC transporter permease [Lachnoanaerobaculum umeaense]AYA99013.1 ABC transporter permease [Lachnoanaerobaculum umeaense]PZW95160.1 ABC-type spermidine/putrescine transport system permease subunit II [Lachnoanaerobaculum umeaense]